jgi:small basic protein
MVAGSILAFVAAVIYAVGGALKGAKEGEVFKPAQFLKTVILAIIVNAAVCFMGVPVTEAEAFAGNTVTTIILDKLVNYFFPTE